MRVITGDCSPETATTVIMPRAFLVKKTNYSNCPLKKRPVNLVEFEDDQSDNSEPENLSTKPEDLRLNTQPKREPQAASTPKASPSSPFGTKLPLEPLDLNALKSELPYQAPPPPPAAAAWVYPPHGSYVPFAGYQYPSPAELFAGAHHPHYPATAPIYPIEAYHDRERSATASPPQHVGFSAACLPHPSRPTPNPTVAVVAPHHGGLSPTSSTSSMFHRYSPPPATPEDLSSPGSVASSGSLGSAGTGKGALGVAGIKKQRSDMSPRYECPDCAKSYSTFSGLSKHRQFHCVNSETSTAQKSFSCKFCDKTYVSLGALKMHIRTHTLPCKCPMCNKAFSRPWLLQGHIRTHTGEKPFSCQHCNRAFADRSNLRAHLQTHAEVKKYNCPVCSKTFSRMSLLNKHAESGCR